MAAATNSSAEAKPQVGLTNQETNYWDLTDRQLEIFKRLPLGESRAEIAKALHIVTNTVSDHMKRIFVKTDTNDRLSTTLLAYQTYRDELSQLINIDLDKLSTLSATERRILVPLSKGLSNSRIGELMDIPIDIVRNNELAIYERLEIPPGQIGIYVFEAQMAGLLDDDELLLITEIKLPPRASRPRSSKDTRETEETDDETPLFNEQRISSPTEQWQEPFRNKAREALKFAKSQEPDSQSGAKIRQVLIDNGFTKVGSETEDLSKQEITLALLLMQNSTSRLLTAAETAEIARDIVMALAE